MGHEKNITNTCFLIGSLLGFVLREEFGKQEHAQNPRWGLPLRNKKRIKKKKENLL